MASLKALRLRIKSIKSTQKITKAMQMVAASKLRRSKNALEKNIPYYEAVESALHKLPKFNEETSSLEKLVLNTNIHHKKMLALVITSERGLCGGFNQSILRKVKLDIDSMKSNGVDVKVIAIGKKGLPVLASKYNYDIINHHSNPNNAVYEFSSSICSDILNLIEKEKFDSCKLYFSYFKNAVSQIPQSRMIIPALHNKQDYQDGAYECEGEELNDEVIKMYLSAEIYRVLLESKASEEASRMVAMDNATKNAGEMIDKLTLIMNRSRQATITKELIEIISGAEAI